MNCLRIYFAIKDVLNSVLRTVLSTLRLALRNKSKSENEQVEQRGIYSISLNQSFTVNSSRTISSAASGQQ